MSVSCRSRFLFLRLSLVMPFIFAGCTPPIVPMPPSAPEISAVAGDAQVTVSWSDVSGAASYNLYWSTAAGVTTATGTKIGGATSPYSHTGLANGATYYYAATSVNASGESAVSAEASATPVAASVTPPTTQTTPPAAPVILAAAGDTLVTVTWSAVAGAASYNLYWSTTAGVTTATGTKIGGVTSPYSHTGRANGTTYYYVATAVNAGGESAASAEASAKPVHLPDAPSGTAAAKNRTTTQIAWSDVSGATSYNLYWSETGGVTKASNKIPGVTSPFDHAPLSTGTRYYYALASENADGESTLSAQMSAVPAPYITAKVSATSISQYSQTVSVYEDSTPGAPVSALEVKITVNSNTYTLTESASGVYTGSNAVPTGAAITIDVLDEAHFTSTATMWSAFPPISTPADMDLWDNNTTHPITWTDPTPVEGASFVVGVYDLDTQAIWYYGSGTIGDPFTYTTFPMSTHTTDAPNKDGTPTVGAFYYVAVGVVSNSVSFPLALPGSYLVMAGVRCYMIQLYD